MFNVKGSLSARRHAMGGWKDDIDRSSLLNQLQLVMSEIAEVVEVGAKTITDLNNRR